MLTHIDKKGRPRMVDVSSKKDTDRIAVAKAFLLMKPRTLELIKSGGTAKGDVLNVAKLAGIGAAKYTPHLIPLCHTLIIEL
ncbi:MAG: cyclic pyranopterin monophosphate synthase MoaC, partial [Firmicutes bacterium]|nr:cyclic pyranopterin monophosphate synthase MoaC [Bacillota bacterium]